MDPIIKSDLAKTQVETERLKDHEETDEKTIYACIDNLAFWFHYRISFLALFFCAVVASTPLIKGPSQCVDDNSITVEFLNIWCLIHPHVLQDKNQTHDAHETKISYYGQAHPGVAPLVRKTQTVNYKHFYVWAAAFLYLQMVLFYLPRYIWKCLENGRMHTLLAILCKKKDTKNEDEEGKNEKKEEDEEEDITKACDHDNIDRGEETDETELEDEEDEEDGQLENIVWAERLAELDEDDSGNEEEKEEDGRLFDGVVMISIERDTKNSSYLHEFVFPNKVTLNADEIEMIQSKVVEYDIELIEVVGDKPPEKPKPSNMDNFVYAVKTYYINYSDGYFRGYMLCELLNLFNLIVQLFLMDYFLGYAFGWYGLYVLTGLLEQDPEKRDDIYARIFPKVTKCSFSKYGPSGDPVNYDNLCVLQLNIVNEKIYAFLWFWFIIMFIMTVLNLLQRLATLFSPKYRTWLILHHYVKNQSLNRMQVAKFLDKCTPGDWFILSLLRDSLIGHTYVRFLNELSDESVKKEGGKVKTV